MAVAFELDTVHAAGPHALRRISIVRDDALNVPVLHLLGEGAMRRFTNGRWCEDGKPVAPVPTRPTPEMGELDHDGGAVLLYAVGQSLDPGNNLIAVGMQVAEG